MTTLPIDPATRPDAVLPPAPTAASPWRALRGMNLGDRLYRVTLTALALVLPLLLLTLLAELVVGAWPAIRRFGLPFVWTSVWDPVAGVCGAARMIFGTLASSLLALLLAVPLALGVAIHLTECSPKWLRQPIAFLVELLAAIPSVVYGLWGIFVQIPFLRSYVVPPLRAALGWTPLFSGVFYGSSLLAGGIILAIMIVPYVAAVSRAALLAVSAHQRDAALGMVAPPRHERPDDVPGGGAVVRRGAGPRAHPRRPDRQGGVVPQLGLLHPESRSCGPDWWRGRQRDRRDGHRRRVGRADRVAHRHRHRPVPRRVRLRPSRLDRALRRRRIERHAVDRDRYLRLDMAGQADGALLRAGGRRRARGPDGSDDRAHQRRDGAARAPVVAGGRARARLPALAHVAADRSPHGARGDRHRLPRGHRAHRGGNRAAPVHRARQPQLQHQCAAADADPVAADLHLRDGAVRGVAPPGVGGGDRPHGAGAAAGRRGPVGDPARPWRRPLTPGSGSRRCASRPCTGAVRS